MFKKAKALDYLNFLALGFGVFATIVLTRVDIVYMAIALPAVLLIKVFLQKEKLRDLIDLSDKWFIFHIFLLALVPIIIDGLQGDSDISHKAYWLQGGNSFLVPVFFIGSALFIQVTKKIMDKKIAVIFPTLLISISFAVDFIYSFIKEMKFDEYGSRWEGSANNPNVWAVQATLVIFLLIASRKGFQGTKMQALFNILAAFPLGAILLTRSMTNLLALGVGVMPIVWGWASYLLVPLIVLCVFLASYILFGDISVDRADLVWAKKFYPRIKIWNIVGEYFRSTDFNALIGLGYEKFRIWAKTTNPRHADHVHNAYLQYFLAYGLAGLYAAYGYIYKFTTSNKYLLGLAFYILISSSFDVSFFFYESQMLFWLIIPLLADQD